jgi:Ni,Fe-hydrogenase III small subunit
MLKALIARISQGNRTGGFPSKAPALPDRFRGRPVIGQAPCAEACCACTSACPAGAIEERRIDMGRCLFCGACEEACPSRLIKFGREHQLAALRREELVVQRGPEERVSAILHQEARRMFGRSLRLRQVSAGGCNACEADANVLGTLAFDMGRFGIEFVASPRHADALLVTGPVSKNMALGLRKTWEATPDPKLVIASGACAISGGVFAGNDEVLGGAAAVVPVDLWVPGCPPSPYTLLDALLRFVGILAERS